MKVVLPEQTLVWYFKHVKRDVVFKPGYFRFTPPVGVDVMTHQGF